ncbi:hypothetical protein EDB92DRAFT_1871282 [Lactarius akahatsu]|uniref:Uncharacterized protein n=1 Tax=Lactarius akahatsu TaxID=416441 RepID=A0AAD4LEH1_9AGAM|nr:hypothetical protein EDB92DRAFT_1871282 [Lactarius akahatsu]
MVPSADTTPSPTDFVPPPSYQLSQEQFDRKTSHAIQLSSSIPQPIIDEDGWPIYDEAAFEAVAKSYEQFPPGSSSAGLGADMSGHERQNSFTSLPPSTGPMKNRSSERRRRNRHPDPDFLSEDRLATPPPPFTATGPSLDGPPFEDVVTLSYPGPGPQAVPTQPQPPSLSRMIQPIAPLRLPSPGPGPSPRFSDPQTQTQTQNQAPSNPYHSQRLAPAPPNIPSRLIPSSTITRVEFDPQMAYSPNGRNGNNSAVQGGASAFYNHAVASQLSTSPTMTTSPQGGYPDRVSYSTGYSGDTYRRQQVTSTVSHSTPTTEPRYATISHGLRFSAAASLQPAPPMVSSTSLPSGSRYPRRPSGPVRGPLPPVPHGRWGGSEAPLVQDVYGGNG